MNTLVLAALFLVVGLSLPSPARAADKTPAPAQAVVQVSVTDVDAFAGKTLPPPAWPASDGQKRDDLSVYESAASYADVPIVVTPRFSVTTPDGKPGIVQEDTRLPYLPLEKTPGDAANALRYAAVTSRLSATPQVHPDGTITVDISLAESKNSDPSWRELGPPNIVTASVTTKITFRDGETRAILPVFSGEGFVHFSFLTVKLVPAKKA